jgi:hypothetical protein
MYDFKTPRAQPAPRHGGPPLGLARRAGLRTARLAHAKVKKIILLLLALASPAVAGPTNPILFVTQVPIPGDFASIASTFGNHSPALESCGRGGDLYIRYADGTVKNLTRAGGYGRWGAQFTNGIAVRQPCVHWSGKKAVFSMVVGAPRYQFDYATTSYWQLYEITNFTDPNSVPVITKVANQPATFNNISPIYGSDGRILFTSDRPRNGQAHLYPQLDEYEEQATVTGIWSLDPVTGDLFMVNHTPSGAFSPVLDSAGRVVFSRWDHLQRDQQADTDWENGYVTYGTFNWSDESPGSVATTNQAEVFPEPRPGRTDLLAGTGLAGHTFNQFFPWAINQDGTGEETLNHIGRHELGGSYASAAYVNDPNIQDLYYFGNHYNTNTIDNFLDPREDPAVPGLFYGIDAPEFGTHGAGQIVAISGATNLNAYYMRISYVTARSTHVYASSPTNIPPDHTGLYRSPLKTTDGYLIASHTAYALYESGGGSTAFPSTAYDFRLKILEVTNGYYAPSSFLTGGLTNRAVYWTPDALVTQTNLLWEFDPVEVVARPRPDPFSVPIPAPELAAFSAAGVEVERFQDYLRTHELALIVSRDVTTRDRADHLQPFNLRIAGNTHQTLGAGGKIYDIAWLQLFQADQLRSLNYGSSTPRAGRRVLAQYLHEPAVDNPYPTGAPLASVPLEADGSYAALVPARRAMTWQLTDTNGTGVVRERYWLTFAPGEIRSCTSCHGINLTDQAQQPPPTNTPSALIKLLDYWKTNIAAVRPGVPPASGSSMPQITFTRRQAETGVTYHVQHSSDLRAWAEIASYSGSNIVLSASAREVSRVGTPTETITVQDVSNTQPVARFLRLEVTRP